MAPAFNIGFYGMWYGKKFKVMLEKKTRSKICEICLWVQNEFPFYLVSCIKCGTTVHTDSCYGQFGPTSEMVENGGKTI